MTTLITAVETLAGDKFYTVVTGDQTEVVSAELLLEMILKGIEVEVATDEEGEALEDLYYIHLDYMEVSDEEEVIDVYRHPVSIKNGELEIKEAQHEKEYKSIKAAVNYATKQGTLLVKLT